MAGGKENEYWSSRCRKYRREAYLPTYAKIRVKSIFILLLEIKKTKKGIHDRYGFEHLYDTIDELIEHNIEALHDPCSDKCPL